MYIVTVSLQIYGCLPDNYILIFIRPTAFLLLSAGTHTIIILHADLGHSSTHLRPQPSDGNAGQPPGRLMQIEQVGLQW